ncbi:MAG: SigB/SigF/SigG family RNA polymerase sigma factor [Thermoleophilaceae bacterium]
MSTALTENIDLGERRAPASRGKRPAKDERLLARYRETGDLGAREELIARLLPLTKRLASRYRHSGESQEDLEQVACIGLIKAVDRYEPDVGPFTRYAVPNILGELRRHFRDKGWGMHVPRTVQENFLRVNETMEQLSGQLRRTPTPRDVAEATGMSLEDVIEALDAGRSYSPAALDAPHPGEESEGRVLGDTLGSIDRNFDYVELGQAIAPAFSVLPKREQVIVHLRFFEDLTQSEIAERVGISQMHVSRLLRAALDHLNEAVDPQDEAGDGATAEARG